MFADLIAGLPRFPDAKIVVQFRGKTLERSFVGLHEDILETQRRLQDRGVAAGMHVGLLASNSYEWIVHDLALLEMGCKVIAFPQEMAAGGLAALHEKYALNLLLLSQRDGFAPAVSQPGVALLEPGGPRTGSVVSGRAPLMQSPDEYSAAFSSGSTGTLKCMAVSVAGTDSFLGCLNDLMSPSQQDSLLMFLPLSHFQQRALLYFCLRHGADAFFVEPGALLRSIQALKPSLVLAPPSFYEMVATRFIQQSATAADVADLFPGIRYLFTGMAPIRRATLDLLHRLELPLHEVYGLTECGLIAGNSKQAHRPGSVGRPLEKDSVEIAPDGEILVKKRHFLTARYLLASEEENQATYRPDGTIATGDIGYLDPDGFLHLSGRKKNLIIRTTGYKLHPESLEAKINQCPEVRHSAVIAGHRANLFAVVSGPPSMTQEQEGSIRRHISEINRQATAASMIDRVLVTDDDFTAENGLLTRTLKLNRTGIYDRFIRPLEEAESNEEPTSPGLSDEEALPADDITGQVQHIVRKTMGQPGLAVGDNLFERGADSLVIAEITSALYDRYQRDIAPGQIFGNPTIAGLVAALQKANTAIGSVGGLSSAELQELAAAHEANLPSAFSSSAKPGEDIFITGCTGWLGRAVLTELLAQTDRKIHCLVRAKTQAQALERLGIDAAAQARVIPVLGDLQQPRFGLTQQAFETLGRSVGSVYHVAAWVNYLYPYEALEPANVGGTADAVRLASIGGARLHHVSTMGVSLFRSDEPTVFDEAAPLEQPGVLGLGYAQSKWVAEKLVATAAQRGLSVSIYRPGEVSGDSVTGYWPTESTFTPAILKATIQLGMAPPLAFVHDLSPVDWSARSLVALSLLPPAPLRLFHLVNPHPLSSAEDVWEVCRQRNHPLRAVSFEEWATAIARDESIPEVKPFLSLLRAQVPAALQSAYTRGLQWKAVQTHQQLRDLGIEWPSAKSLVPLYLGVLGASPAPT